MARRTRNSARTPSVLRWFHKTHLFLHRWLRPWRALASRETLRRLIHRRTFVPALEGLEDRVMPSSGQSALTLPSPIPSVMAQTPMGQAIEQRLDTAMMAARQTYARLVADAQQIRNQLGNVLSDLATIELATQAQPSADPSAADRVGPLIVLLSIMLAV